MELVVKELQKPQPIEFNYEDLKAELTERVAEYKTVVYTEDTIKQAKQDRSNLNRLDKALNDERIRLEKEYMAPFADFKAKVTELCGIVKEASRCIDKQVKEYEELQKEEKTKEIYQVINDGIRTEYPWLDLSQIWNAKWLNVSYSMKQIRTDLEEWQKRIAADLGILSRLPEYAFEAQDTYKRTLKIEDAMWEADHLKQMDEAKKAQDASDFEKSQALTQESEDFMPKPIEPDMGESGAQIHVLQFRAYCTMGQAQSLRKFMVRNDIRFERL